MTVEAVLLDFYGTLAEAVDRGPSIAEVMRAHGGDGAVDPATLSGPDPLDGTEHLEPSTSRAAYVAWERARLRRLAASAGIRPSCLEEVVDDLHRAVKTYTLRVYDEVFDALDLLRGRGLGLAVCSNWDWDLPDLLDRLGLAAAVDVVVTSARAGARKPHPRIYAHTLELLGVEAADALFVGDSLGPDVSGPRACGIPAAHLVRDDRHDGPLPEGAFRVSTLLALTDRL